jgi:hypothetical protein
MSARRICICNPRRGGIESILIRILLGPLFAAVQTIWFVTVFTELNVKMFTDTVMLMNVHLNSPF